MIENLKRSDPLYVSNPFGLVPRGFDKCPVKGNVYFAEGGYMLRVRPDGLWGIYLNRILASTDQNLVDCFEWLPYKPYSDTVDVWDNMEFMENDILSLISHYDIFSQEEIDKANEIIENEYLPEYDPNGRY